MIIKFFSTFILMCLFSSVGFAAQKTSTITNPMKYAVAASQAYAGGDSNDSSGWRACWFNDSEPEDGITAVQCDGSLEILVHGGEMVTRDFQCEFQFEESLNPSKYFVTIENCE
jgi:hypothetical protein